MGVPQGSVIGPLLFNIYVNDMQRISDIHKIYNFADDTVLLVSSENIMSAEQAIGALTPKIYDWLCANRLSLNTKKTYYQIYSHLEEKPNINIEFSGHKINRTKAIRYLGVTMDEKLDWKAHISRTLSTVSRNIGLISRARYILDKKSMLMLYHAIVLPHYSYCAFVWGTTYPTNLDSLVISQKRIVRRIENVHYRAHTSPIFKKLNILKLRDLITQQKLLVLHNFLTGNMPISYARSFNLHQPERDTRQTIHFVQPSVYHNYRQFAFTVACPRTWNDVIASRIPDLNDIPASKYQFKKITKKIFVDNY